MPAFSAAISGSVVPRYSVWSIPTLVTAVTTGSRTLVLSRRPPRPTSTTVTWAPRAAKSAKAIAVVASKKLASDSSIAGRRWEVHAAKASSPIGRSATTIRSRTSTRWGEVYRPTRNPASHRAWYTIAATDPFPLVPPIWMTSNCSWGFPISARRRRVGSRDHFLPDPPSLGNRYAQAAR